MKYENMHRVALAAAIISVAACGSGGGGGDGGGNPQPQTQETVVLSEQNAASAAGAAASTISLTAGLGTIGGSIATGATIDIESTGLSLRAFLEQRARGAFDLPWSAPALAVGVTTTETVQCIQGNPNSGRVTVTLNDANNDNRLSAGDSVVEVFDNCQFFSNDPVRLAGEVSLSFTEVVGDPSLSTGSWRIGMSVNFNSFRTIEAVPVSADGTLALTIDTLDSNTFNTRITSPNFTVVQGSDRLTLTDLELKSSETQSNGRYTAEAKGILDSSELNGVISFSTPTPFSGIHPSNPNTGVMTIVGANGTLTLRAVDAINVRLELDTGSDGTIDRVIPSSWDALGVQF